MPSSPKTTASVSAPKKAASKTARKPTASSDAQAQEGPVSAARALKLSAAQGTALSPEMNAFNRALARIDKLNAQIAELNSLGQQYQHETQAVLAPLMLKISDQQRKMVRLLDEYLTTAIADGKKLLLSKTQRETAVRLVCGLSAHLAHDGDPIMTDIHNRHSPIDLADLAKAEQAELHAMMEAMMKEMGGQMPEATGDEGEYLSPEAMLHHALKEAERLREEDQARRAARAAKRQAKKAQTQPDSAQAQAIAGQEQAEQTLKTMFRQIASRLHPDREPDETERKRKTALMSEANAAYERKDLVALMQIQLQAELVDADHASRLSAERLKALTLLLKQQAATLDGERQMLQAKWMGILQLPWGVSLTSSALTALLNARRADLEEEIAAKEEGLAEIETAAGLKKFLTEQRRLMREEEKYNKNRDEGVDFF